MDQIKCGNSTEDLNGIHREYSNGKHDNSGLVYDKSNDNNSLSLPPESQANNNMPNNRESKSMLLRSFENSDCSQSEVSIEELLRSLEDLDYSQREVLIGESNTNNTVLDNVTQC